MAASFSASMNEEELAAMGRSHESITGLNVPRRPPHSIHNPAAGRPKTDI